MALITDARFEGKRTCAFKNDMRNLASFHQSTFESPKIGTLMGSFHPKQKIYELKNRGICVMTMKNDTKFEEELTCQFKIDLMNLTSFDPSTRKSQKLAR